MKPYSPSCDENKQPILAVLREVFAAARHVLEIGSGTGQHAVFFAENLPHLVWQSSDVVEHWAGIRLWLVEAALPNTPAPLVLDVGHEAWPVTETDAIFSANTTHIMAWPQVEQMFVGLGRVLRPGGVFALYGPFNYNGNYTSDSNAHFDRWLQARDPLSGVRDFETLDALAQRQELRLLEDYEMPANNRTLVWRKQE
jgi:SAM-dependent methyltransferase